MAASDPIEQQVSFDDINPIEFYGVKNEKLDLLKKGFPNVKFVARGSTLKTMGEPEKLAAIEALITSILEEIRRYGGIDTNRVRDLLIKQPGDPGENVAVASGDVILRGTSGQQVRPRTSGQRQIIEAVKENDVVFAVGPAGTGKTYVAVALAVQALRRKRMKKLILVRPAVEAGEQLGFLPGDLKDKIDPYLRPLYDSLSDMIHSEKLSALLERNVIEIAPLAYMRGRTLNHAFIILDEAQNATTGQLKMFLTRMGENSKIIVTGDASQIDLPRKQHSGLLQAMRILSEIEGISFVKLGAKDVVRHPLVRKILAAYEVEEERAEKGQQRREQRRNSTKTENQDTDNA